MNIFLLLCGLCALAMILIAVTSVSGGNSSNNTLMNERMQRRQDKIEDDEHQGSPVSAPVATASRPAADDAAA